VFKAKILASEPALAREKLRAENDYQFLGISHDSAYAQYNRMVDSYNRAANEYNIYLSSISELKTTRSLIKDKILPYILIKSIS